MMIKYLLAIILLLIPFNSFGSVKVSDLYPAGRVYDAGNQAWNLPAKILAKGPKSIATNRIALGLTKGVAGGITTVLLLGGAEYLGNYALDWLLSQNPQMVYDTDDIIKKHEQQQVMPPSACMESLYGANAVNLGTYSSGDEAYNVCGGSCNWNSSCKGWHRRTDGIEYYTLVGPATYQDVLVPVPAADLQNLLEEAIDDATDENAPVIDLVNHALDKAQELIGGGVGINALPGSVADQIEDLLNTAIPEDVATDLENELTDPNAIDQFAEDTITDADEAAATTNSITDALTSFFGANVAAPVDVTPGLPTKLSLTSIMQSFMNSVNNMPIITTLRGITVNASGSSVLCVDLPANYGGSKCYDASSAQSTFNMIGTILLSMTTIFCFIQLFRG